MKMQHTYPQGERWEPARLYDRKQGQYITWPRYYVSNWGRVARSIRYKNRKKDGFDLYKLRLVKPWVNTSGWVIALWDQKVRKMAMVRNLVADAFQVRSSHTERIVCRDGDEKNCRVDNLRPYWMRNNRALSPAQVEYCRQNGTSPADARECATRFLVSEVTVWRAINDER